ncbi:structural protein P5 [Dyella kyungheensis]|uniref:structural protein P5 n=1 Tax=Dyella kyungheensis TaxID=1242174 RepID=UPI003CED6543
MTLSGATTRGERNNNPGNIRLGSNWQGLAAKQTDPDFCVFVDVKFGFRALAKVLTIYQQKGFDTVRSIIERWAPENENNTSAYISAVAATMKVDPNTHLDVQQYDQMFPLVDAITRHENGRNIYLRTVIDAGLALAGIVP